MYERFSEHVRKVMVLASLEAQGHGHEFIGTEHVLLGLFREGKGVAATVLRELGVTRKQLAAEVDKLVQKKPVVDEVDRLPPTPEVKHLFDHAVHLVQAGHDHVVGTEHVLLSLLAVAESVGAQVLRNLGLTAEAIRTAVAEALQSGSGQQQASTGQGTGVDAAVDRKPRRRGRIDGVTLLTCQGDRVTVRENMTVAWEDGVITQVEPTLPDASATRGIAIEALAALKGRPLGTVLVRLGLITQAELLAALDQQRAQGQGAIGQILLDRGKLREADVDAALAVQAGRAPSPAYLRRLAGAAPGPQGVQIIDGRGKLLIPGLVNTHHHLYQSLTRCMPRVQNATLFDWLTTLYPYWRELNYDALKRAATISLAELLLSGCTTSVDHMYLFPRDRGVKLEAVLEAADLLGMRIHACRGSMSLGSSAGGLPPDECVQPEGEILADCVRVVDRFHDARPMAMRRIDLAPCSPFSITPGLLDETRALAVERKLLLHTHAAETLDEERFCKEKFGLRPIAYLREHGWLASNCYFAHCVHLDVQEIGWLAETGTGVAHCPSSNMRLASGIAPIRALLDAGVKVGLAVDGSSSNDGGNLLAEARQALLLQRVSGNPAGLRADETFRLATAGGAAVLNRPELGRIEPGAAADLVLFDAHDVALAGAVAQDPVGALMMGCPPRPERVIVAGMPVVQDGRIAGVDWPRFVADFNQMVRERFAG